MTNVTRMQQDAQDRHQEVLEVIEALSDTTSSDRASTVWKAHYLSQTLNLA
jgi:hypothetical protein